MAKDKLFVIGIGGTGMRCLEAFIHLCAIGMFSDEEIEVLTLDTDALNGNLERTINLVDLYSRIKTPKNGEKGGTPNNDTFFSAKLNLYRYNPDYSQTGKENYRNISKMASGTPEIQRANKLVSDLFLDSNSVQEFNLAHGYRAQTHLGSHLMYHGITESAKNLAAGRSVTDRDKDLDEFLQKLFKAGSNAKIFVFGSVFGGTGASSIPIIPKAFQDFVKIRDGGKSSIDLKKVKFGATLLTEYFSFKKPDAKQMETKSNSVIADSSFFPLNSQTALQFYQDDPTVQQSYNRFYHIGWPVESKSLDDSNESNVITGGANQKNHCHVTELLCATAAYDFFTGNHTNTNRDKAEYVYKAAPFKDNSFNFRFADFVGEENNAHHLFRSRLGAFLSLSHIVLSINEAAFSNDPSSGVRAFIHRLNKQNITDYNDISDADCEDINKYFRLFAYSFESNKFKPGWIYQVRSSALPGTFMFSNKAFPTSEKELKALDVGALFTDSKYHWPGGGFLVRIGSNRFDKFIGSLVNHRPDSESQKLNSDKERLLGHLYVAITKAQDK